MNSSSETAPAQTGGSSACLINNQACRSFTPWNDANLWPQTPSGGPKHTQQVVYFLARPSKLNINQARKLLKNQNSKQPEGNLRKREARSRRWLFLSVCCILSTPIGATTDPTWPIEAKPAQVQLPEWQRRRHQQVTFTLPRPLRRPPSQLFDNYAPL